MYIYTIKTFFRKQLFVLQNNVYVILVIPGDFNTFADWKQNRLKLLTFFQGRCINYERPAESLSSIV